MVWIAEKEFNVGRIDEEYPIMKLFNLFDDNNVKEYKKSQTQDNTGNEQQQTFG